MACEQHTGGTHAPNETVATCWDADRLDLPRVFIQVKPQLLCTKYAKDPVMIETANQRVQRWLSKRDNSHQNDSDNLSSKQASRGLKKMTSDQRIIYITGRGGDANKGLGAYLKTIDSHRIGLSVNSIFLVLPFEQQLAVIHDLLGRFDGPNTSIIANSYGAYLLTSALIDKPAIASQVLLLSPALGLTIVEEEMFYSRPPNQRLWSEALEQGRMTKPSYLAVCAGELDAGSCSPIMVRKFSELINVD